MSINKKKLAIINNNFAVPINLIDYWLKNAGTPGFIILLILLIQNEREITLKDLSKKTGLTKTTCIKHLRSLESMKAINIVRNFNKDTSANETNTYEILIDF